MFQTSKIQIFSRTSQNRNSNYKSLSPDVVLDGVQLVCGESSSMDKKEQTMRTGWINDPVHPNGHIYAKMALNLIKKMASTRSPAAAASAVTENQQPRRSRYRRGGISRNWQLDKKSSRGSSKRGRP
jgi:hypothetical protein